MIIQWVGGPPDTGQRDTFLGPPPSAGLELGSTLVPAPPPRLPKLVLPKKVQKLPSSPSLEDQRRHPGKGGTPLTELWKVQD